MVVGLALNSLKFCLLHAKKGCGLSLQAILISYIHKLYLSPIAISYPCPPSLYATSVPYSCELSLSPISMLLLRTSCLSLQYDDKQSWLRYLLCLSRGRSLGRYNFVDVCAYLGMNGFVMINIWICTSI